MNLIACLSLLYLLVCGSRFTLILIVDLCAMFDIATFVSSDIVDSADSMPASLSPTIWPLLMEGLFVFVFCGGNDNGSNLLSISMTSQLELIKSDRNLSIARRLSLLHFNSNSNSTGLLIGLPKATYQFIIIICR